MSKFQRYRVEADGPIDLDDHPTTDDRAFDGDKQEGLERLAELRDRLRVLQDRLFAEDEQRVLVVLQAMDAAGKDSTIRDVFRNTNPSGVRVHPFGRPSAEELAHDYLWRIHAHTPERGHITIFNRSHYEDVLVVRVNELVPEKRWRRRYRHIAEFERMLAEEGTRIIKFFLHISKDDQKEQLQQRLDDPDKRWKFEPADFDARNRWDDYMEAFGEAIGRTSTDDAPWYVIPSGRRWYRKLAVAEIMVDLLEDMNPRYPPPAEGLDDVVIPD